jgi:2-oxoisovalerate dehydrogenase E1 component beta subunit
LAADAAVFLIGQDIWVNGGVFRVTDGLLEEFGASRIIGSPLA